MWKVMDMQSLVIREAQSKETRLMCFSRQKSEAYKWGRKNVKIKILN